MKKLTFLITVSILSLLPAHSYSQSVLGEPGSGQPTNTLIGVGAGAALGAAIGDAAGSDGSWIGALVGSIVGGTIGNSISTEPSYHHPTTIHRTSYHRPLHRPGWAVRPVYHRPICPPRPVIVEEVVYEPEPEVPSAPPVAPYGHLSGSEIKSPWSDFTMSVGGLRPGQIVYDGLTGKPFMVP
ncbi:MAG: glycine zipper domain-containing protein [Verrucomicrobiota bacterium]